MDVVYEGYMVYVVVNHVRFLPDGIFTSWKRTCSLTRGSYFLRVSFLRMELS